MNTCVEKKEIAITGHFLKVAKLRHEWCDFIENGNDIIPGLSTELSEADLFTFITDVYDEEKNFPYFCERSDIAALNITTYDEWWHNLHFKVRNKVRKALKEGVEIKRIELNDDFIKGVEKIYNESPHRQGRPFYHFGKGFEEIKQELNSFLDRAYFIGAYYNDELVGFAKLFHGNNIVRTIHIIAKLKHRTLPIMDTLISESVKLCEEKDVSTLQYGSWTGGGVGVFRKKHGFERLSVPRYFVPLNLKGKILLRLRLHRQLVGQIPENWREKLIHWRKIIRKTLDRNRLRMCNIL